MKKSSVRIAALALLVLFGCKPGTTSTAASSTPASSAPASSAPVSSVTPSSSVAPSSSSQTPSSVVLEDMVISGQKILSVGETVTLLSTASGVSWISEDATIASVDAVTGAVFGVKAGTVKIDAKKAGYNDASYEVEVVSSISETRSIVDGATFTTKGVVMAVSTKGFILQDKAGAENAAYAYSTKAAVAVGDYVKVSGTVSNGSYGFELNQITVTALPYTAPTIDKGTPDIISAKEFDYWQGTTSPYVTIKKATVTVSDPYINFTLPAEAGVTRTGSLYVASGVTVAAGSYDLTVFLTGLSYNSSKTKYFVNAILVAANAVTATDPETITVTAANDAKAIASAQTLQMTAAIAPYYAEQGVTWTTDNAKVTVDDNGLVTCAADAKNGDVVVVTATSKFTDSTVKGTYQLKVDSKLVTITAAENVLSVGETVTPTYTIGDGTTQTLTYTSSDDTIATVDATTGVITAVKAGKATISAAVTGYITGTFDIEVVSTIASIRALTADTSGLTAKGRVLSVASGGMIIADANGEANTLWIFSSSVSGFAIGDNVKVSGKFQTKYPTELSVAAKDITKLDFAAVTITNTATAYTKTEMGAYDGKTLPYVSIANAEVAVNSSGYASLTIDGYAKSVDIYTSQTVTAGFYDVKGYLTSSTKIYLESLTAATRPAATGITITAPGNETTIIEGSELQLTAAQTPFGALDTLTWTCSDTTSKVTVSSTGLVKAAAGSVGLTVTITATSGTLSGTYSLTVESLIPQGDKTYDISGNAAAFKNSAGTAIGTSYGDYSNTIKGVTFETTNGSNNKCSTSGAVWAASTIIVSASNPKSTLTVNDAYFNISASYAFTKMSFTLQNWNTDKTIVSLQYSSDGSTWNDDATAAVSNSSGATTFTMTSTSTFSVKYARIKVTATAPTATSTSNRNYRIGVFSTVLTYPNN
jgi:hypothetical protein